MNSIHGIDESLDLFAIAGTDTVERYQKRKVEMKASIKLHNTGSFSQKIGRVNPVHHRSRKPAILLLLKKLWQRALKWLTVNEELQVWQQRDRAGNMQWNAYDPRTQISVSLHSEDEMRAWIENHYYTGQ